MKAGQLRRRVTLKNVVRVSDGVGGSTRADAKEVTVWGNVAPVTAREEERSMRREQRISHVITLRWRPDLAAEFGPEAVATYTDNAGVTRTLAVKTLLDPDDRSRMLKLGCLEGGPT